MNRFLSFTPLVLAALVFPPMTSAQDDFVPPVGYEESRYEPLWTKSPFTLASTEEIVTTGFADNLILVGVATIGDRAIATVLDRTTSERQMVTMTPNERGFKLVNVGDMSDPLKASVRLQLGSETAEIRFDPMLVKTGPAAINVAPVPGQPGRNPRAPRPNTPVPIPSMVNPASGTIVPPPPQREGGVRRRVIIPSQPAN